MGFLGAYDIGVNCALLINVTVCGFVVLEENSVIGSNATIIENIRIGKNAFVGAGSLVRKNVQPDTVVGGVPAKVLNGLKPPQDDL